MDISPPFYHGCYLYPKNDEILSLDELTRKANKEMGECIKIYEENMQKPCFFCNEKTVAICEDCDRSLCDNCGYHCQGCNDSYCPICFSFNCPPPLCYMCDYNEEL